MIIDNLYLDVQIKGR